MSTSLITWNINSFEALPEFKAYNTIKNKLVVTLTDISDKCYVKGEKYRIYKK